MENEEKEITSYKFMKTSRFSKSQAFVCKKIKNEKKYGQTQMRFPKINNNLTTRGLKSTFYGAPTIFGHFLSSSSLLKPNQCYNSNDLKQEISLNKSEMNAKKYELQELKIKFNKLHDDNRSNKNLLAKILGIDLKKEISREELIKRLERCKPSDEQKKKLRDVREIMKLKKEMEEKRRWIVDQGAALDMLKKNVKFKVINELENDYIIKCEQLKNLLKKIKTMEELIQNRQKDINELENEYKYKKDYHSKLCIELKKTEIDLKKSEEDKNKINNIIIDMNNRHKRIKDYLNTHKINIYINALLQRKKQIEDINKYKEKRDNILKQIEEKKENIKKLEKQKNDQEKEYEQFNKKIQELSRKEMNYKQERPRLEKKAIEPLKDQKKMVSLLNTLEEIKLYNDGNLKNHEENQKKLIEIKKNIEKELNKNKEIFDKNTIEKKELLKQIRDLKNKIFEIDEKILENKNTIDVKKKEFDDFVEKTEKAEKEKENKKVDNKEDDLKKEEEEKKEQIKKEKEYKKILDSLKKQKDILKNENVIVQKENDELKNDIKCFEEDLAKYTGVMEKLRKAEEDLNKLKNH